MSIEKKIIETVERSMTEQMTTLTSNIEKLVKTNQDLEAYTKDINLRTYTLSEASNICGIKKGMLLNMAKNQDIDAIYIGNKYLISHKTLSRLINGM